MTRLTSLARQLASSLRRIIGVPDYERYLAHVRAAHPDRAPLTRADFLAARLEDRYSRPGARCC
ncbi:MAG TPA: YbdD/YjiX family protein [Gemmatimonadaceae bacterium]|nr:YbdD/YjiX family protein [Gemmatimonadaceae bacterium]